MKNKFNYQPTVILFVIIFFAVLSSCTTNNWSQFRGPDFNMVVASKDLPTQWNDSLNVKWTHDIVGESWSSPIVYGEKIFYSTSELIKKAPSVVSENDSESNTPPDNNALKDVYSWKITCVDLNTGNELWSKVAFEGNPRIKKHAGSTYACETPVTDGKRIYVYFGMVGVYCYNLNGNLLWEKDLDAYETQNGWGTGSSPVVHDEMLYIQADNDENSFLIALNVKTGEEKWKVERDEKTTYGTPAIWKNTVRTELVTLGKKARSYNLVSGELIWELKVSEENSIPSPVFDDDYIYFGNAGRRDPGVMFAVKAGAKGDITPAEGETKSEGVVWSNTEAGMANPSPLLHNGLIYVLASRGGEISCLDAASGDLIYKEKIDKVGACWASPWINNDRIYFYDEKGVTSVVKTGKEFELLSQNTLEDKFWASVAITQDAYIFKGVGKLYCVGK